MPNIGDSRSPQGPGIIPFRHRGFDDDTPAWDLDKRIGIVGLEITGRDDNQTPTSLGNYKEDVDTRGDLNCANYWQSDYQKRPIGCWGFGYASVVTKSSSGTPNNTTGGSGDTTQTQGQRVMEVLPIGKKGKKDDRFKPKNPMVIEPVGGAGGDPNAPGNSGDPGNSGASGTPGINPGADPSANNGQSIDLGGGWQYIDGAVGYFGPTSQTTDTLSGFNGGYWGGSIGFSFTGGGGVATLAGGGSGFAGFGGIRNFFGGSSFPAFTYR